MAWSWRCLTSPALNKSGLFPKERAPGRGSEGRITDHNAERLQTCLQGCIPFKARSLHHRSSQMWSVSHLHTDQPKFSRMTAWRRCRAPAWRIPCHCAQGVAAPRENGHLRSLSASVKAFSPRRRTRPSQGCGRTKSAPGTSKGPSELSVSTAPFTLL